MFERIVVGCDGAERGLGAVSLAAAIAVACGARIQIVAVDDLPPIPYPEPYGARRQRLEHDLATLRNELAPTASTHVAIDASPARALRQFAERERADLIVVGSRHRRRLTRLLEGDIASQVLHSARCCVAIAPDPIAPPMQLRQIGVGIADTPESLLAMQLACDLARRCDAGLELLCVVDDQLPNWLDVPYTEDQGEVIEQYFAERREEGRTLLDARLDDCGTLRANGELLVGEPAGEIVLASEGLDLLILGSRRWGLSHRLAVGSTADRVIRRAPCPVLVTPRTTLRQHVRAVRRSVSARA